MRPAPLLRRTAAVIALALPFILLLLAACSPRPPLPPSERPDRRPREERPGREAERAPEWEREIGPLRVALRIDVPELGVIVKEGGALLGEGEEIPVPPGGGVRFAAAGEDRLTADPGGGARTFTGPVTLLPNRGGTFVLGETPYGGALLARPGPKGLTAVNVIGLEEYLRGVVPWEIGWLPEERIEALEAQAVAARTYALTRIGGGGEGWDLVATESDQVYMGLTRTDPVVDRAIRETAGVVATYGGEFLRTYYSSTCGGIRSDLGEVWFDREGAPYLRGGGDGPGGSTHESRAFCRKSPHFSWSETWSGEAAIDEIVRALAAEQGVDPARVGRLENVRIEEVGRSGRVKSTLFEGEHAEVRLAGDRVRWVLRRSGGGILRSTWFTLDVKRSGGRVVEIRAEGRGFGHGIGMCQWGAMGMADEGYRYDEILRHYYPGVRLRTVKTRPGDRGR
ncbi:MAG: SpoIID/LytB domain-containing protein [Candidatus Eisenbacteria bacterium]